VEKVFNYTENPKSIPEFWPSLMEVINVQRVPNGGTSNTEALIVKLKDREAESIQPSVPWFI